MPPGKLKGGKSTKAKKGKNGVGPPHGAGAQELQTFMKKTYHGSLKMCLQALSGDGTMEVSDALLMTAKFLLGDEGAQNEVASRLAPEDSDSPKAQDSPFKPPKQPFDEGLRMEHDQWLLPVFERCLERTMKDRMYLGRTGGGAAQRLAHQLLEEAKAFQAAQPHGSIIPCIPLQGESASPYQFANSVSETAFKISDLVNTGSLLMLVERRLDESDLDKSIGVLADMVDEECRSHREACRETSDLLINAIKRHRGLKASIDDNDRDVVAGALAGSRSVVMAAALDIVGTLESMKGKLEVSASSRELQAVLAANNEVPAESTSPADEDSREGAEQETKPGDPETGSTSAPGDKSVGAKQQGAPEVTEAEPSLQESDGGEGLAEDSVEGSLHRHAAVERAALDKLDDLILKVQRTAELALSEMEGDVEAVLYDSSADMIARIFLEERAIVQLLSLRPWQVRIARTHQAIPQAIDGAVGRLGAQLPPLREPGPKPISARGKAAFEREVPYFEVMTVLVSSACRCVGDAERSLGIGLDPDPLTDLEFLEAPECTVPTSPTSALRSHVASGAYGDAMKEMRAGAEETLRRAISRAADLAGWSAGSLGGAAEDCIPARLLTRQLEMCRALQRLQSRLMCVLKSAKSPNTVLWDPDSLQLMEADGVLQDSAPDKAVQEFAAMVPVLRAAKGLHGELTAKRADGERSIADWLGQALITIAELERCCLHLTEEIQGFAEIVVAPLHQDDVPVNTPQAMPDIPAPSDAETANHEPGRTLEEFEDDPAHNSKIATSTEEIDHEDSGLQAAAEAALEADIARSKQEDQPPSAVNEGEMSFALESENRSLLQGLGEGENQDQQGNAMPELEAPGMQEVADILQMVKDFMQGLKTFVESSG